MLSFKFPGMRIALWLRIMIAACCMMPAAVAAPALQAVGQPYTLGPGDVVRATVWNGNEYVEEDLVVADDGTVIVPFGINRLIDAQGMTALGLRDLLQSELAGIYRDPVVQAVITAFESRKVLLVGEVLDTGQFPLLQGAGLLEFIMQNSGFSAGADLRRIRLTRVGEQVEIDVYNDLILGGRADYPLQPDDIIYVPSQDQSSDKYFVLGAVNDPGMLEVSEPDRDYVSEPFTLLEALSRAGSMTSEARTDRVMVFRTEPGGGDPQLTEIAFDDLYEEGDPGANVTLEAGDVIYVPRNRTTRLAEVFDAITPVTELLRDSVFLYDILRR